MKDKIIELYWLDLSKGKSGLGPNSWGWLRIFLPYQKLFYPDACEHDEWYTKWYRECDKIIYDERFRCWISIKCKTKIQEFFWEFYHKCVRLFWDYYFNYKTTKK